MKPHAREIIDFMLNTEQFKNCRSFETEHFIYWIEMDKYFYDGLPVTRDEFNKIREYTTKYKTLPSVERKKRMMTEGERKSYDEAIKLQYKIQDHPENRTDTFSRETILRYSKTYDSLEYYNYYVDVRSPMKSKHNKVLVMKKKIKIFSVNSKGYVMTGDNKWLSLKNWARFQQYMFSSSFTKLLMKTMIGKDWILNLDIESYMISNKSARKSNSFEEAVSTECGAKPVKTIRKLFGDNVNEVLNLYSLIEPNKIHYLTNIITKHVDRFKELVGNSRHSKCEALLFLYFISKDNRCDYSIFNDYIRMLKTTKKKINLNISSYNTIKLNHDRLSREILEKKQKKITKKRTKLKINEVYPDIKPLQGLGVEKIKTVQRLNDESAMLHHCVHSYRSSIDSGLCAIYSLLFKGESYTLELRAKEKKAEENRDDDFERIFGTDSAEPINKEKEYELYINQLRGKYNCSPPTQMKPLVEDMCEKNGILPLSDSMVTFVDKVPQKEENEIKEKVVKQIGEKILYRISLNGVVDRVYEGEKDDKPFEEVDNYMWLHVN